MLNLVKELQEELAAFPGRSEGLRKIYRWHNWAPMFYRPNLSSHSKKVAWLVAEVSPVLAHTLGSSFDIRRALALALVHDDPELITGDYQAATKQKMSKDELAELEAEESVAIYTLAKRFPKTVGGYVYRDLLEEVIQLPSPESQVAKFLDRFDAQGEAWHEMFGGNIRITQRVTNEYGVNSLPYEFYHQQLPQMLAMYPYMKRLADTHLFFKTPELRDWSTVVLTRAPHTKKSLTQATDHAQYDEWRQTVLDSGDSEEIKNLYTQQEFLP